MPRRARWRRTSQPGAVVVTKSTVPVGTGDEVERIIREARPDLEFSVASNPEFLREGAAIDDFKRPDRVVIGVDDEHAATVLHEIYRPLLGNETPLLVMKRRAAELTKYAANAFLATKISFINEIADLCEKVRADVHDVARGIGLDSRIGARFLQPGPGYGGSCFPKDTLALLKTGQDFEAPLRIVEAVVASNDNAQALDGPQGGPRARRRRARQDGRAARPDLQGQHRRHARFARRWRSCARCRMPAPRCAPTIPKAWSRPPSCSTT